VAHGRAKPPEEILFEAADPLLAHGAWPMVDDAAAVSGYRMADVKLDGDSAVVLVSVVNALHNTLGLVDDFARGSVEGAELKTSSLAHLLRFVVRAGGPLLLDLLANADPVQKEELRELLEASRLGTSAVEQAREAERARWIAAAAKEDAEAGRRAQAARIVAAEQATEREGRIAAKLTTLSG
jgi:hypothetical protein